MADFKVKTVAVIGAGASGLVAARYLDAENVFESITVLEQRPVTGGLWNQQLSETQAEPMLQTMDDYATAEDSIQNPGRQKHLFHTPVYKDLEANIPHFMMQFSNHSFRSGTQLFPTWKDIRDYLHHYASDLTTLLTLNTHVQSVVRLQKQRCWLIETKDLNDGSITKLEYDAVVVANGHLQEPFIPPIDGIRDWEDDHPGSIIHSKDFREAEAFRNTNVLVIGNSASGLDISSRIATTCSGLIISQRRKSSFYFPIDKAVEHVAVTRLLPLTRCVEFADGTAERDIDHIIFCTGYTYHFPFLSEDLFPKGTPSGNQKATKLALTLHGHIFHPNFPSLAFVGIPEKIIPFPVAEAQAAVIAKVWSNSVQLSSIHRIMATSDQDVNSLALTFPKDMAYLNTLCELSGLAKEENQEHDIGSQYDGISDVGVSPIDEVILAPHKWGEEEKRVRPKIPSMKRVFDALGDRRHAVISMEDLEREERFSS